MGCSIEQPFFHIYRNIQGRTVSPTFCRLVIKNFLLAHYKQRGRRNKQRAQTDKRISGAARAYGSLFLGCGRRLSRSCRRFGLFTCCRGRACRRRVICGTLLWFIGSCGNNVSVLVRCRRSCRYGSGGRLDEVRLREESVAGKTYRINRSLAQLRI